MNNHKRGVDHHKVKNPPKLSADKARAIYAKYHTPCRCCGRRPSMAMLGAEYGVNVPMIHFIVTGRSWSHATGHNPSSERGRG